MAAYDTHSSPSGHLAALVGIKPTELAEIRAEVARDGEVRALRTALEIAAADLSRAHQATMMVVRARSLAEAHKVADVSVVELAVAHRVALHALETIGQPTPKRPGAVVPFPGPRGRL